jgi:hypothetical protein
MCWYSVDHTDKTLQAEAGQRLGIRKVHGSSWAVRESDLHTLRPSPVCLIDQTTVLFRFSEDQQVRLQTGPEAEAVFRMLKAPKRDVFQFSDGREVEMSALRAGLVFDVLVVPGREHLSAVLKKDAAKIGIWEEASRRKSLLARVLQRF